MTEYFNWCNSGGLGLNQTSPEMDAALTHHPKSVSRGRSITPRRNVNAASVPVETVCHPLEKETMVEGEEEGADASLDACMFVPFVEEEREDQARDPTVETTQASMDVQAKVRARDPAPSPPRFRGHVQFDSNINEVEMVTDGNLERVLQVEAVVAASAAAENDVAAETRLEVHEEKTNQVNEFESLSGPASVQVSDDISVSSLFDFLADALSFVDSTASTQKASGTRQNKGNSIAHYTDRDDTEAPGPDMERSCSHSTMSTRSDMSHINEEEAVFVGSEILESVPENDVMDKLIEFDNNKNATLIPSMSFIADKRRRMRFQKQKPSKILKKKLRSLSVLVYGKRIARHNFMHEEK